MWRIEHRGGDTELGTHPPYLVSHPHPSGAKAPASPAIPSPSAESVVAPARGGGTADWSVAGAARVRIRLHLCWQRPGAQGLGDERGLCLHSPCPAHFTLNRAWKLSSSFPKYTCVRGVCVWKKKTLTAKVMSWPRHRKCEPQGQRRRKKENKAFLPGQGGCSL